MRPPKAFPEGTTKRLQWLLKHSQRPDERVRIQAVLMRALLSATPAHIASVTGLSVNSVRILHSRFLREGEGCLVGGPGRGGRRHGLLGPEEQKAFLQRYEQSAAQGLVLSVAQIKHDYETLLGHAVSLTSVCRMMAQSGWRKIVLRPYHPKKAPGSEEAFKKSTGKSSRKKHGRVRRWYSLRTRGATGASAA